MFRLTMAMALCLSMAFCSKKDDDSKTLRTEEPSDSCADVLEVFVRFSVNKFLTEDKILYLSQLSEGQLKQFFPYAELETLKALSLDLQALKHANLADELKDEALGVLRKEAEIDKALFARLYDSIEQWDQSRLNELNIRSKSELMGLPKNFRLTQMEMQKFIEDKLSVFSIEEALKRFLSNAELRRYYLKHAPTTKAFRSTFLSKNQSALNTIVELQKAAGLPSDLESVQIFKGQVVEFLNGNTTSPELLDQLIRVFANYVERAVLPKNLSTEYLQGKFTDYISNASSEWARSPFRVKPEVENRNPIAFGAVPTAVHIQSYLNTTSSLEEFYIYLLMRDFFAKPVKLYAQSIESTASISELFEMTSNGKLWNEVLTTTKPLSRAASEIIRHLSGSPEQELTTILGARSPLSARSKYLIMSVLGLGGLGGAAYGIVEITNGGD